MARLLRHVLLSGALSSALLPAFILSFSPQPVVNQAVLKLHGAPIPSPDPALESWIKEERLAAFNHILENIGPNGANATGTGAGCILASPTKVSPNYYYQWVRDGAITISSLVEQWQKGKWPQEEEDQILSTLLQIFMDWINMQDTVQHTQNPSGGYYDGGLGEPKFEVNGSPFVESWGRPQRDSPALRISALASFLKTAKITKPEILHDEPLMRRLYAGQLPPNSIIKADLEYVSHNWREYGFDAWEEVNGLHFFTAMAQLKAMEDGSQLALQFKDDGASGWYDAQRKALIQFVRRFWDWDKGHLISTLDIDSHRRSGLNCDILLGALHGDGKTFPPWSNEVLSSMAKFINLMETRFPNPSPPPGDNRRRGVGIGRYMEDVYDGSGSTGGYAWFICTSSVAHVLYSSIEEFISKHKFTVTQLNLPFWKLVNPEFEVMEGGGNESPVFREFNADDELFNATMAWMFQYADSFIDVVRLHVTEQGRMSEQFDTKTGGQRGAKDLTWSYGSFLSAVEERARARKALYGE